MCGICGIFHRSGRPVVEPILRRMIDVLEHRGPDDFGVWYEGQVGLGHRRLAIRDLSPAGHQPQCDPSGQIVVSYNGEIYNDREVRAALARDFGLTFRSTCDTEIIPVGYLAWGEEFFHRLEGMFAIALWDRAEKKLVLARDGVGIKPIFYSADQDVVRFASEIKALLADPHQSQRLSSEGVHRFLARGYCGPTSTTLEGIRQVPPGTVMTFTSHRETSRRFWQPKRQPDIRSVDEAVDGFLALWPQVVRDQLVSDVPVGILQSGGIDSTLVSLAANDSSRSPTPLFTAQFADKSFDEVPLAASVAKHLGAPFHPISVAAPGGLAEVLRRVVKIYDGQVADEASIPLFLLSAAVRQHVKVALSGDGGDEFFGGYQTYAASPAAAVLGHLLPRAVWQAFGRASYARAGSDETRLPLLAKVTRLALGIADGGAKHAHAYWRRLVPAFLLNDLYGPELRPLVDLDPFEEYRGILASEAGTLVDRCLVADQRFHLPGGLLLKSDAMSMAHGLEIRVPLLDRRVMEFAGRIDARLLLGRTGDSKRVLRAAARRLGAPEAVVSAGKRGFNTPLARLLRVDLRPLAEDCFDKAADRLTPWLEPNTVRRLWREHRDAVVNHDYALWPILNLSLWLDETGGKRGQAAVPPRAIAVANNAFTGDGAGALQTGAGHVSGNR
ncbi:asparagine synthase (glutamine-hydrolyzing) [Bradyrhizobium tropiciagri]|uniref:asparagine synthase (glutamine-hydrolyzing) n=1 Tax=Bradyrhizobium tropiciagri TaxID=312253 RepID=UPI001BAA1DF9|nr:asparagine synthase (glutamine-hydrolyzing) [Bradyrhizobium tropiciagri]